MLKFILYTLFYFLINFEGTAVPIDTPEVEERNDFVIRAPDNWGYRTFRGKNGLIGVLWPSDVSFNMTDTAIFVFLQTADQPIPAVANNINLFKEKCPGADFKFFTEAKKDPSHSLGETYFSGRCGRTVILFKETIKQYSLIFALISGRYVSKQEFEDTKQVVSAYKIEVKKFLGLEYGEDVEKYEKMTKKGDDETKDSSASFDNENRNSRSSVSVRDGVKTGGGSSSRRVSRRVISSSS